MTSANVTLRALSLGTPQDTTTGYYPKTFVESTKKCAIFPKGVVNHNLGIGGFTKYDFTGYSESGVCVGDEILDAQSFYYDVRSVLNWTHLDTFVYAQLGMVKLYPHADRAATSGTWITVKDPRERMRTWLTSHLTAANLKKDNGATLANYIVSYDGFDYPAEKVFVEKDVDLIFTVSEPVSTAVLNADKTTDGYHEQVPITISVVNKAGITGANLKWQAEAELRRLAETYEFGSIYQINKTNPLSTNYESAIIHSYTYLFDYVREKT